MDSRGQTALEYLLIVVVVIMVIVAVVIFLQNMSSSIQQSANDSTSNTICATTRCTTNGECTAVCGAGATCDTYRGRCNLP